MKILIRSTTLDGEPIPGSGETLQAADCLEVVELMRGQTPFTASRAPRDYMTEVLSGIEGGPTQPLPEDAAAAAAEFLTRLARHGLIEFLPDDKASDPGRNASSKPWRRCGSPGAPTCSTTRR